MIGFVYELQAAGIPVSIQYVIDFYRALAGGLASDMDQLFLLARLIFVKKVEYFDVFEQVFASFFMGRQPANGGLDWEEILAASVLSFEGQDSGKSTDRTIEKPVPCDEMECYTRCYKGNGSPRLVSQKRLLHCFSPLAIFLR